MYFSNGYSRETTYTTTICSTATSARLLFERDMGIERPGFRVLESGLWIHPRYPEMACSPDGLVMDPSERDTGMYGLLEIKCYLMLKHGRKLDFGDFTIEVIQKPDKKSGVKRSEKANMRMLENLQTEFQTIGGTLLGILVLSGLCTRMQIE